MFLGALVAVQLGAVWSSENTCHYTQNSGALNLFGTLQARQLPRMMLPCPKHGSLQVDHEL